MFACLWKVRGKGGGKKGLKEGGRDGRREGGREKGRADQEDTWTRVLKRRELDMRKEEPSLTSEGGVVFRMVGFIFNTSFLWTDVFWVLDMCLCSCPQDFDFVSEQIFALWGFFLRQN